MTTAEVIGWWLVAVVGLGGSMLCSGIETGLYATSPVRAFVRARASTARTSDKVVATALEQPDRTLTTLLVFNNVFNYVGTLAVTALLASLGLGEIQMLLLQAAVLTPVLLIFAESLPKELFRAHAEVLVPRFAPALAVFTFLGLISGAVPLVGLLARAVGRVFGIDAAGALRSPRARSTELIKHGSDRLSEAQSGLIDRALKIETTRVVDEMVPLHAVVTMRDAWTGSRARREAARRPHSHYPVVDEKGRVVGVVGLADLVRQPATQVRAMMQPCVRLSGEASAWDALGVLRRAKTSLGVVERNGQPVGVVTHKDLIEPLTGDLRDW